MSLAIAVILVAGLGWVVRGALLWELLLGLAWLGHVSNRQVWASSYGGVLERARAEAARLPRPSFHQILQSKLIIRPSQIQGIGKMTSPLVGKQAKSS